MSRGLKRTQVGRVVKDKMDKSVIVEVARTVKHGFYGKYVRRRSRFAVHDERNECRVGDQVKIVETRPISKRKRWRVQEKLG